MILLEKEIESALRTAIRTSLNTYGAQTPALQTAIINCYWLADEDNGPAPDAESLRVGIMASPSSSAGYIPSFGFEPIRNVSVDVFCVSQPDSDGDRAVCAALYEAVRVVFETPGSFTLATGITFGGMLITNGGAAEIDNVGQVTSFTVEMKVSL